MIVKEIIRYKKKVYQYTQPVYPLAQHSNPSPLMGKLEYAMFVRNLPFKVGDLIVPIHYNPPYPDYMVTRLRSIDEIHRFIQFGRNDAGPMCLELEEFDGRIRPGRAAAKIYKLVNPSEYPDKWKEKTIVDV